MLSGEVDGLLPATINEGGRLVLLPTGVFCTKPVELYGSRLFGRWWTGTGGELTTMVDIIIIIAVVLLNNKL